MELISRGLLSLFILLFWGNSHVYAHVQHDVNTCPSLRNFHSLDILVSVAANNADITAVNLSQRTIKKEKAIIEDNDDEDEDDDDKSVASKKYSLTGKSAGVFCFSITPNAHSFGRAKRCYPFSKHLAIASSCRLFIRNRVIRI